MATVAYLTAEIGLRTDFLPIRVDWVYWRETTSKQPPSTVGSHNWSWRATDADMTGDAIAWFGEGAAACGRR